MEMCVSQVGLHFPDLLDSCSSLIRIVFLGLHSGHLGSVYWLELENVRSSCLGVMIDLNIGLFS